MKTLLLSFASVVGVSLVSFVGILTLSLGEVRLRKLSTMLISFAAGSLLGDAFIHLIPGSFTPGEPTLRQSLLILGGIMVFFIVEKLIHHRHEARDGDAAGRPELVAVNLVGDAVHNFIDGVLIGASYLANTALGVSTTMAVLFHEIPHEIGDFAILIHSGMKPRKAVLFNFASASVAILGTAVALLVGSFAREAVISILIPVAAGGFVYLAAADLIPELQLDRSLLSLATQAGLMALGMSLMAAITFLE
jgi:zinc and cadmium transporter